MQPTDPKLWLFRIVRPGTFGRISSAIGIALFLYAAFWSAGALKPPNPSGVVFFFIAIIAYIIPAIDLIHTRARACLTELSPLLPLQPDAFDFDRRAISWQIGVALIGISAGLVHSSLLTLSGNLTSVPNTSEYAVFCGTLLVWLVLTTALFALFELANVFKQLAEEIQIELLMTQRLRPFGKLASTMALSLIGAQAAMPIMFFDGFSLTAFVPGFVALLVPIVLMVLIPMAPIRRRIHLEKERELESVNAAIMKVPANADSVTPGIELGHPGQHLASLLAYRREIDNISEWPIDVSASARLVLYLLIPPATWIGAALIEHLVDGIL